MTSELKPFWIELGSKEQALPHHAHKRLKEMGTRITSRVRLGVSVMERIEGVRSLIIQFEY